MNEVAKMDEVNAAPAPVEQTMPAPEGYHPDQPGPPYAAPFPLTPSPQEMMGRVVLGFVFLLIGWRQQPDQAFPLGKQLIVGHNRHT